MLGSSNPVKCFYPKLRIEFASYMEHSEIRIAPIRRKNSSDTQHAVDADDSGEFLAGELFSFLSAIEQSLEQISEQNEKIKTAENDVSNASISISKTREELDAKHGEVHLKEKELQANLEYIQGEIAELTSGELNEEQKQRCIEVLMGMIEDEAGKIHRRKMERDLAAQAAMQTSSRLEQYEVTESESVKILQELRASLKKHIAALAIQLEPLFEYYEPKIGPLDLPDVIYQHIRDIAEALNQINSMSDEESKEQLIEEIGTKISSLKWVIKDWTTKKSLKKERALNTEDDVSGQAPANEEIAICADPTDVLLPEQREAIEIQIRWLIRRDNTDVLAIESECFSEFAWSEEDLICCLRQRNCIGMVATHECAVVGYMIYEVHELSLNILNFAVSPTCKRRGIGTSMIDKLVDKLSQKRRRFIDALIRETNLDAQLFFKKNDFFFTREIDRNTYEDTEEDAYHLRYTIDSEEQEASKGANRKSKMAIWHGY